MLEDWVTDTCATAEGQSGRGPGGAPQLSATRLNQHNDIHNKPPPLEWIVVRIEVTDTGCGIRPKDMVQSKLFCEYLRLSIFVVWLIFWVEAAFNQTEQGRLQGLSEPRILNVILGYADLSAGGKGTGLGLALVRQIVKLSGGRLGLQSKVGEGSTFWVELRTSDLKRQHNTP